MCIQIAMFMYVYKYLGKDIECNDTWKLSYRQKVIMTISRSIQNWYVINIKFIDITILSLH